MQSPTPCNQCCSHASWSCRGHYLCHGVTESYSSVGASTGAATVEHTSSTHKCEHLAGMANLHRLEFTALKGGSFRICGALRDRQR